MLPLIYLSLFFDRIDNLLQKLYVGYVVEEVLLQDRGLLSLLRVKPGPYLFDDFLSVSCRNWCYCLLSLFREEGDRGSFLHDNIVPSTTACPHYERATKRDSPFSCPRFSYYDNL